ncbi:MAG: hypothetical protein Q7U91_14305 [Sideroxyarcus sp.]|nr:hypothetical protein [Sideroxyarcus sp.]
MDKKTVFIKTAKGDSEGTNLSSDLKRILSLIDGKSTVDELAKRAPPSLREGCRDILGELEEEGYIRDKNRPHIEPKITVPKFNPLKMFTPKPSVDLDFNTPSAASTPNVAELAARQKADEAAQLEAAVAAAKARASAEAASKAEAKARQEAEIMARGKALAEAEAAAKAEAKAKKDAEIEERARAVAEANAKREAELRAQAGAKAKQEALARMQAEQEAARNKAALEAAAKVRAEIEAAARAQQVAEAKAKEEAAARLQAQHEAARAKAALEVAARAKAAAEERARAEIEAAARAQQEAEAKAKRDAEAARLKVEQEAARVKAELEAAAKAKQEAEAALLKAEQEAARIRAELAAAKERAEAEAKAVAEARAKQEAEAKALAEARAKQEAEENARREAEAARIKAEHAAALLRAEQEAVAKVRAEAEARDRREAEEHARREAEVARVKAEHEAALVRAEQEAVARVRAEADARLRAEDEARAIAEALAKQLHEETVAKLEAEERAKRAIAEAVNRPAPHVAPAYEIQLDDFTGAAPPAPSARPAVVQSGDAEAELDAEQLAAAKAASEMRSASDIAAEMARLKEESEAARHKLQEEARRKEEEEALAEEQAKAWAEAEQRAITQSLQEVEQAAQVAQSLSRAQQMPIVRKRRKPLPLGKISFALSLLAIIVAVVLPYVYPLEEYIAPLEKSLSAQMKQPVRIGKLSASSLPPKLTLHSVTLGSAQEVKVAGIVLSFDVFSLLSDVKVIDDAELQDVSIQGALLDKQAASLKLAGANRQYPVRHLTVQRLKIVTDEVALPVFSGIADIDVQGAISRVALHSADDKLGIDLQPDQGRWQLGINMRESSLFFLPDVVFSDLSAKGVLGDGEINFTEFDAHIYNGMLMGSAKLNWLKGWQLQGHLEAKTFELNKMFPKYGIEGELYGEGAFSFSGEKISQMVEAPTLDGSFSVKKGIINGFDMVETARLLSREHMVGGRTHFDDLIGLVQFDNHITRFRQVRVASNMLSASGTFDVSATNQLGGKFGAEIKMRTGNNALTLFGTVTEPKLRAGN